MESERRRPSSALERELQVLNQKAERDRAQRLQLLDKQFRFCSRKLQQRKEFWRKEQTKVCTVRTCEPKAIVDIAMNDINELRSFREVLTARGTRRSLNLNMSMEERSLDLSLEERHMSLEEKLSRSISAPVRQRHRVQASVSLLQMKDIALIDSISEREKALRRQRAWEEMERTRRAQREALQRRVEEFIERLKDRSRTDSDEEPP